MTSGRVAFWRGSGRRRQRPLAWGAVAAAAVGVSIGVYLYWQHGIHHPSTDDAYVQAHVIQVAAEVTGRVVDVPVSDQQAVEKGQLLFRIDPRPFQYRVDQARADLALAEQTVGGQQAAVAAAEAQVKDRQAQLDNARTHYHRVLGLAEKRVASPSDLDDARARLRVAEADLRLAQAQLHQVQVELGQPGAANDRIRRARAALAQDQLDLAHTEVEAPCAGRISRLELRPGDTVRAEDPQFALVCSAHFWVYANFKETDITRIRSGQVATLHVDTYPDHTFHGIVEAVNPASGAAFSLLPPENATGNWVKVTQRVPVRILVVDDTTGYPLRVQTSAEVSIDTGSGRTPLGRPRGQGLTDAEALAMARGDALLAADPPADAARSSER